MMFHLSNLFMFPTLDNKRSPMTCTQITDQTSNGHLEIFRLILKNLKHIVNAINIQWNEITNIKYSGTIVNCSFPHSEMG